MTERSRRGDDAGQDLCEEMVVHVAGLRRYAMLLVGDPVDADDIVQDTLMRVLAQARGWREVRELKPYLFATLHNVHIEYTRRRKRTGPSIDIDDVVSLLSSPATQHKRLELRDLAQALTKLPLEQREVVLLVGVEGMSYSEVAEAVDVPIGTVMSRLSRGREALRQLTDRKDATKLRVVR